MEMPKRKPIRKINEPKVSVINEDVNIEELTLGKSETVAVKVDVEESFTKTWCVDFLSRIEGWKTRTKNLHWAARHKNIHEYLDEFLDILSDYQDGLAEGCMGIFGSIGSNDVNGTKCSVTNAFDLIDEIKKATLDYYEKIPQDAAYAGIRSECETFIQNINKYDYLFHLCEV